MENFPDREQNAAKTSPRQSWARESKGIRKMTTNPVKLKGLKQRRTKSKMSSSNSKRQNKKDSRYQN